MVARVLLLVALIASLVLAIGCGGGGGGGGGGGPTTVNVFGRVLWIETGAAPSPVASVQVGSTTTTTDPIDGSFTIAVPTGTTSITVTYAASGSSPTIVRTFSFPAVSGSTDIGDVYIGPETVSVVGRVVRSDNSANVAGASVSLAGVSATTLADGTFTLPNVAYSSSSLAVFLGLQGSVSRTGFFTQFFSPTSGATAGVVDVGTIQITPEGSGTPPPAPFNISGNVLPAVDGPGATVELLSGASVIRTTTADASGRFTFWAPAGTYTIRATKGAKTGTAPVTLTSVGVPVSANVTIS